MTAHSHRLVPPPPGRPNTRRGPTQPHPQPCTLWDTGSDVHNRARRHGTAATRCGGDTTAPASGAARPLAWRPPRPCPP
eukprot:5351647-Prymnesium_polylepis.2